MSLANALTRRIGAGFLAAASVVYPALAAENNGVAAKVAGNGASVVDVRPAAPSEELKTPLMFVAGKETEGKPLLAIVVFKGVKDEAINKKTGKPFTGEEMGLILAAKLGRSSPRVPPENIKIFVEQVPTFNYSGVAFFLNGRMVVNGILPAGDALTHASAVADAFELEWRDLDYKGPGVKLMETPATGHSPRP